MKSYWWILGFSIVCAIFSKQIDSLLAKCIVNPQKRAVAYCLIGAVALAAIGVLIGKITSEFAGGWSVVFAIAPVTVFALLQSQVYS